MSGTIGWVDGRGQGDRDGYCVFRVGQSWSDNDRPGGFAVPADMGTDDIGTRVKSTKVKSAVRVGCGGSTERSFGAGNADLKGRRHVLKASS